MMELQLLARILVASGITATASTTDVSINSLMTVDVEKSRNGPCFWLSTRFGETSSHLRSTYELSVLIDELRDLVEEFSPAHTKVRLEGSRFQPDFQQMDHAEIAAWRLEVIGYDWLSDEPEIALEDFKKNVQSYWDEALADGQGFDTDRPKGKFDPWGMILD